MALLRSKLTDIPPDAVLLSEDEALKYQLKVLKGWKDKADTLALKLGPYVLGGASFLCGLYINNYYRNKYKLYNYGRLSSYLPICVIPATVSALVHVQFTMKDVVLQKRNECPLCVELKASAMQAFLGCVFPFVLGNASSLATAQRFGTYDVPFITIEPIKVLKLIHKNSKPILNVMLAMFVGQALLASTVTYFEAQSVIKVNTRLTELERELENS